MSGLGKLSNLSKATIFEVARMSYGKHEGEKGGRGHMGLLQGSNGALRVIKFDTHGGTSTEADALASSNNLRTKLMAVAEEARLSGDVLTDIRRLLDLPAHQEGARQPTNLLDRSIAAQVVEKIAGARVWSLSHAKDRGANGYASAWHAMFRHVSGVREDTSNVKTVNENNRLNNFGPDGGTVDDNELSKFGRIAHEHRDAEDFYVRFTADGLDLESAGSYTPLRSLKAKRENNYVRQRLWDCVSDRFRGHIPESVRRELPPLDGSGLPLSAHCIAQVTRAVFNAEIGPTIIRTTDQILATLGNNPPNPAFVTAFRDGLDRLYPGLDDEVKKDAVLKFAFALCRNPAHDECLTRILTYIDVPADDGRVAAWRNGRDKIAMYSGIYHNAMAFLSDKRTAPTSREIDAACERLGDEQKRVFVLMVAVCWSRKDGRYGDVDLTRDWFRNIVAYYEIDELDPFVENLKGKPRFEQETSVDGRSGLVIGACFDDLPAVNTLKTALATVADIVRREEIPGETERSVSYELVRYGGDILSVLLPAALEKARALQPDNESITVQNLWIALELEGDCPADPTTNEGAIAFRNALYQRIARDFPRQAANPESFRDLIEKLAKCPLRYEAFKKAMLNNILPQNSDFRSGCSPQLHMPEQYERYLTTADEWKVGENRDLEDCRGWNNDTKNPCSIPIVYTLNGEKIHTVSPEGTEFWQGHEVDPTRFSSTIPTGYHNKGLTKEQAIVVALLFKDYDVKLLESWGFKIREGGNERVRIDVRTIPGQTKVKVSVHIPFLTTEQAELLREEGNDMSQRGKEMLDHLVHDYTLDEHGFLHDEGLHL